MQVEAAAVLGKSLHLIKGLYSHIVFQQHKNINLEQPRAMNGALNTILQGHNYGDRSAKASFATSYIL